MTELGPTLKAAREAAGISLARMADRVAYAKPYLSQLENGRRTVLPEHVSAYESALGCSIERDTPTSAAVESLAAIRAREVDEQPGRLLRDTLALRSTVSVSASRTRDGRREAVQLLSGIEQYAGWLSLRLRRWRDCETHLDRASVLAMEADAPMRLSTALSFSAYRDSLRGHLPTAVDLCASANRDERVHAGMRAYLTYQYAELAAKDGQDRNARQALASAEKASDSLPTGNGPWYQQTFYQAHRASVLHELGEVRAASEAARSALDRMPDAWLAEQPLRTRQVAKRAAELVS